MGSKTRQCIDMKRRTLYLILTISLFLIEFAIAVFPTTHFIRAYFGDFLVVMLIYCAVKIIIDIEAKRLAFGVFIFSVMIEATQYFHLIDVFGIQNQLVRIIIGTSFSWVDILMYFLGSIAIYLIDVFCVRKKG